MQENSHDDSPEVQAERAKLEADAAICRAKLIIEHSRAFLRGEERDGQLDVAPTNWPATSQ